MIEKPLNISHLGILVTTFCNLNCRDCADLIPKRERVNYSLQEIKSDVKKILELVDFIEEVLVIGGETLMYPYLNEVLDFCREQEKIGKIIITTNGKMEPSDSLLECLHNNRVQVRVSGYPKHVVPNRKQIVLAYENADIEVQNLENMQWMSMGNNKKRNRTSEELEAVFQTCAMKDCVCINPDGKIFYCSRQLSAYETDIYPDPDENEYIDIRNDNNLRESFQKFYKLPFISTCDYCDGISCATSKKVETAIQILNKNIFLDLLGYYELLLNAHTQEETIENIKVLCQILGENVEKLYSLEEYQPLIESIQSWIDLRTEEQNVLLIRNYGEFLNRLTEDYNFIMIDNSPYIKTKKNMNRANVIRVGMSPNEEVDIALTQEDIRLVFHAKYPVDAIVYNKLFIESKLWKIGSSDVKCIVSGLSYTQYGIIEKNMPITTVNLSITGQDTPYSILIAQKALELNPGIELVMIPMTYYQSSYDMTSDDIRLHHEVVSRIDMPILNNLRNFEMKNIYPEYQEQKYLKFYDEILNFELLRMENEEKIRNFLSEEDFFNEINPMNPLGSLKFDFKKLNEEEKYKSAKITASHNERVCTEKGYQEVKRYLTEFLEEMAQKDKEIILFVPPMTKYLYESYSKDQKEFFYDKIVTQLAKYKNVKFIDFANDNRFENGDFCDFEHLSESGATKLTKALGDILKIKS